MPTRDSLYIRDLILNLDRALEFSQGLTRERLEHDELRQYAILRAIELVGEAAKSISQSLKEEFPEVPWRLMGRTRDKLVHEYFGVDLNVIWNVIQRELPDLRPKLLEVQKRLDAIDLNS